MNDLVNYCPLLETLSLDMVLIDWNNNSLQTLIDGCTKLKELSLLLYDNAWDSFTETSQALEKLEKLELTIHCGLTITESAVDHICKSNVTSIRFLQKTSIFDPNIILSKIQSKCKSIKSVEMNISEITNEGIDQLSKLNESILELSLYEPTITNNLLTALSNMKLKDLNLSDMKKTSFSNQFKKLFRGDKIKKKESLLLYDPIANEKKMDSKFKNKIIHGKKNFNSIFNPIKQYEGTTLAHNIVELELSSKDYFQDSDLQNIGIYCTALRWVSLSFPNTYPKTVCSLVNCPELIIVQLTVTQPENNSEYSPSDEDVHEVNRSLRVPDNNDIDLDNIDDIRNNSDSDDSSDEDINPNNNRDNNNNANHRRNRRGINDENVLLLNKNKTKKTKLSLNRFKASSPECQSLVTLSQYGKKIRFLQLCGSVGLTDYTLKHIANLDSLNTFWIKDCNDFTFNGVCQFSEAKWKTLKRTQLNTQLRARLI